ncbi:RNA polymerase sigma-70 factor [Bacillus sp. 31A1R]|uniref:RNA polymerase sigma-70 factor n=1 Tax=Robertmurraya mangrovi TaxID=3098077 RepID=A0ABU5IWE4_9BACI|nr:RNA polymerase sigma-70 factor [Bacillus sp. 31A1R]MDZ5471470.1 RNA polymerase sigma-70 factor [Bacillus sp. 31A1R]
MLQELYSQYQPLLFSIAYRMLGTVTDAEDIVQDVFVRVSDKDMDPIENKRAYLCKMVTNRCLDYLKSAEQKRKVYVGPWLPEPLIVSEVDVFSEVIKEEDISYAVLLLLEKLNPIERAVFILREVLEYDYETISNIVSRSEIGCRKIFSRVKKKLPLINIEKEESQRQKENFIIQNFVLALQQENINAIEQFLSEEVTLYSDGGGKVYAALKPVHTRGLVLRFIQHLMANYQSEDKPANIKIVNINGNIGIIGKGEDNILSAVSFNVKDDQISEIYIVRNPEKLQHITL